MDPISLLSLVPSLFQAGVGASQWIRGNNTLNNLERPQYQIPGEAIASLTMSKAAYADPFSTGELRAQQNIGLGASNAAAQARDGGQASSMAPVIQATASNGYNQLQDQVERDRERRLENLQQNLSTMANYQDTKWQLNEFGPYSDAYNQAREQVGAGQQNLFGGLNGIAGLAQMFSGNKQSAPSPSKAAAAASNATSSAGTVQGLFDYMARTMQSDKVQSFLSSPEFRAAISNQQMQNVQNSY